MDIIRYNENETVEQAIKDNEPLLAVISFDGTHAYVAHIDDVMEHHILLRKVGFKGTEIDRYFRIVITRESADWTFICLIDYKNI